MKERPILFSAPMVCALLAGTKTQTRRPLRNGTWWTPEHGVIRMAPAGLACTGIASVPCPYGAPGDRLWVRETFYCDNVFYPNGVGVNGMWREVDGQRVAIPVEEQRADMLADSMYYRADGDPDFEGAEGRTPWRPSIHMPRWASRITLDVVGVRVERLQDISEADARAEGIDALPIDTRQSTPRLDYAALWEFINGHSSWAANPWVWVVEFKRAA